MSASEAVFRLLGYPLVVQAPAVTSVSVQLPEQERIVYNLYAKRPERAAHDFRGSHPTVWFKRPAALREVAFRDYFQRYIVTKDRPRTCECSEDANGWYVHERSNPEEHLVHVKQAYKINSEQFFARLLLLQPDCFARCWEDVRTVDGTVHPDFHAAARARGLLDDHRTAVMVMGEALSSRLMTPIQVRVLYLTVRRRVPARTSSTPLDVSCTPRHRPRRAGHRQRQVRRARPPRRVRGRHDGGPLGGRAALAPAAGPAPPPRRLWRLARRVRLRAGGAAAARSPAAAARRALAAR